MPAPKVLIKALVYGLCLFPAAFAQRGSTDSSSGSSSNRLGSCTQPLVRREFRELSDTEKQAYIDASLCLRDRRRSPSLLPDSPSQTIYDDLVYVHMQFAALTHNTAQFLPWHRYFIGIYEKLLREQCGYSGAVPYWDWSLDSQAPERSELLTPKWFGANGDRSNENCLSSGQYRQAKPRFTDGQREDCIRRQWRDEETGSRLPSLASYPYVMEILETATDSYNTFREALEHGPHDQVHSSLGGDMANTTISVNDPLFWAHHTNLDRLWSIWQEENPRLANTYNGPRDRDNENAHDARPDDEMLFGGLYPNARVRQVFSLTSGDVQCYAYSKSVAFDSVSFAGQGSARGGSNSRKERRAAFARRQIGAGSPPSRHGSPYNPVTPGPYDRDDKYNIRHVAPIPESYLRVNMKYSDAKIKRVREHEAFYREFTNYVNAADGFVSHNALSYQETASGYRPRTEEEAELRKWMVRTLCKAANQVIKALNVKPDDVKDVLDGLKNLAKNTGVGSLWSARPIASVAGQ
ncbi:uncharacterized protein EV422DRAFT_522645 [Fimicolochytrium jonesii]|uniref:uncharacterized protein n=1 Tax=Fimicolochytrium jonesii TaxID=1396493 RepID=UPI0022FE766B|nr:uncharacterized protein EV422DRAFT_522645 [Fimicolochytrium jonesii]KAI8822909.1 hypothetical protein EV422DRAFT_522645 [Fimicolochytrium jonesii]